MVGGGGHWCVPELLKVAGAENLEGVLVGLANWPGKAVEDVAKRFVERTKEPWFGHDSIFAYVHVLILKEAMERAGVAERHKVMQAIRAARHDRRPGPVLPRRPPEIRRQGPPRRCQAVHRAVAERQAGRRCFRHSIAASDALLAEGLVMTELTPYEVYAVHYAHNAECAARQQLHRRRSA